MNRRSRGPLFLFHSRQFILLCFNSFLSSLTVAMGLLLLVCWCCLVTVCCLVDGELMAINIVYRLELCVRVQGWKESDDKWGLAFLMCSIDGCLINPFPSRSNSSPPQHQWVGLLLELLSLLWWWLLCGHSGHWIVVVDCISGGTFYLGLESVEAIIVFASDCY